MSFERKSSLKHIAELISQIKNLEEENLKLRQKIDDVTSDLGRYKKLARKYKEEIKAEQAPEKKSKDILKYKLATVLFADAQGYVKMSKSSNSNQLVDNLDEIFLELERVASKREIKRLRSIGDSLLCVGGIPQKTMTNPIVVLTAAVEMQYFMKVLQGSYGMERVWDIRFGVHSGPLTVIMSGRKKSQYEVKGETLNLATRIRSFCEPGSIMISADTYEMVKDLFVCEYSARMPVKYKGDIDLYYVRGIKPEYSLQKKGILPNKKFSVRFSLLQFTDLQELMLNKLERELPPYLFYHSVKHTIDVVTQAELIGIGEDVSDEDLLLLKTAALFHDSGHVLSYDEHEYYSTIMVREILPDFYYTQKQIDIICELIEATKMPIRPKNRLQYIICDADLDYLGRSDMIPVSNSLYRELKEMNKIGSMLDWNKLQLNFISGHQYYTNTAQSLREVNKQKQIERIKRLIEKETGESEDLN